MIQWILTLLIISASLAITGYRVVRFFSAPPAICHGCGQASGYCVMESLKRTKSEIRSTKYRQQIPEKV
jgi:hypothetical protein